MFCAEIKLNMVLESAYGCARIFLLTGENQQFCCKTLVRAQAIELTQIQVQLLTASMKNSKLKQKQHMTTHTHKHTYTHTILLIQKLILCSDFQSFQGQKTLTLLNILNTLLM